MEIVKDVVLVLHFLGLAALFGGFLTQIRSRSRHVNAAMLHGALTQLVTGIALVGLAEAAGDPVNNVKIGVKLLVLLVITALVLRFRGRRAVANWVWAGIGTLTVVNVVVAVMWPR